MKIITKIDILRRRLLFLRKKGLSVGFVPTMGALHEGHLSLVRCAAKENDIVIVSIFVNPIQFDPQEDLHRYPRNFKKDIKLLEGTCDIVFAPSDNEMYPRGFCSSVEVRGLSDQLCGRSRKGHFAGVTTVVSKLFSIVSPDTAYLGQKDAQQAAIIKKMASDLNFSIKIKVLPIVRENDGLAMSSRNIYLSENQRRDSIILYQALKSGERMAAGGTKETAKIKSALQDFILRTPSARIDYIEIVDKNSFDSVKIIETDALLLLAVYIGNTRLIDNMVLKVK